MHCHGENGQQAEGFNWDRMPDPRPRDLSEDAAMSTFSDKEIFDTVSREMRDTSLQEVNDDMNYFAVATMPTFKYTLSEEEIWAVVGYVRTLHGCDFSWNMMLKEEKLDVRSPSLAILKMRNMTKPITVLRTKLLPNSEAERRDAESRGRRRSRR